MNRLVKVGEPVTRRTGLRALSAALAAGFGPLLSACQGPSDVAEGMVAFKWDRDTCSRCSMAIGDRRFAVQLRGGPQNQVFKFDDIGCATTWCSEKIAQHPWVRDAATRIWVAEFASGGKRWLDARQAHFVAGTTMSPMGYNYAAQATPAPDALPFEAMAERTAATWPANCRPGQPARSVS